VVPSCACPDRWELTRPDPPLHRHHVTCCSGPAPHRSHGPARPAACRGRVAGLRGPAAARQTRHRDPHRRRRHRREVAEQTRSCPPSLAPAGTAREEVKLRIYLLCGRKAAINLNCSFTFCGSLSMQNANLTATNYVNSNFPLKGHSHENFKQ
jgi:hypothetical protein